MVVTCTLEFDNNLLGTFYAGQLVSGSVILKADKPKDVKAIHLKVVGYAITHWNERRFGDRRLYQGREAYLDSKTFLLGSDENTKSTIQSGTHVYTFACQLPYNCPSSFEGRNGSIRYVVKVVLVRPWKFDQTYTRGFTVLKTVDLNYDGPQLRIPSNTSTYRTFCCRPCKTEPLQLELRLPQTGFVPGQVIPITVVIINNTNIPVSQVNFALVMLVRYFSQHPSKHVQVERTAIAIEKGDSVLRHCTRSLTQELRVPSTPPTCMHVCSIIQIVYQVEVEAKMKGWHGNQVVSMPVSIGNVPLWNGAAAEQPPGASRPKSRYGNKAFLNYAAENEGGPQSPSAEDELPVVTPITEATLGTPTHMYPDMPPPAYEVAVHTERGDINENEPSAFGPCPFAPLYPVYNIPISPTATNEDPNSGGYENRSFES